MHYAYRVVADHGCEYLIAPLEMPGALVRASASKEIDRPAIGDFVALESGDRIVGIEVRRSWIARARRDGEAQVVAANVTHAFVVTSPEPREFSVRRITRYLIALRAGRVEPVILLNKCDIATDLDERLSELRAACDGATVLPISAAVGTNVDALGVFLTPNHTIALCGSSGVGKSTLLNRLVGTVRMTTSAIRADGRGRHTTSHRQLVTLPFGAALIDTPGMRGFTPWARERDVKTGFRDIVEAGAKCRFRDCTHDEEPDCAVREIIDVERLRQWRKLVREAEWIASFDDPALARERKARWKAIHRAMRR